MNKALLNILVCPICKGKLALNKKKDALICRFDKLEYPIQNKIPMMCIEKAKPLKNHGNP